MITMLLAGFCVMGISPSLAASKDMDLLEMSLEELMDIRIKQVVGASKYQQKMIDSPSSTTIITAEQIRRYGYRSLADILRSVRGFYIRNDRNYEYVGFRGISRLGDYSTRVLVLVDGVRMNDNIYDSAPIGADFILDPDLIDRIEIIRGPSYSLYGNNAFFAVINVTTRNGGDLNGFESAGAAGKYDSYEGRISYGKRFEDQSQLLLSASAFESAGPDHYYAEFDSPEQNQGVASGCDGEDARSFFGKFSKEGISVSGAWVKRGKQLPTAPWGASFNDPRTETWDERGFLDIKLDRDIGDQWKVMSRLTFGIYNYDGHYAYLDESAGQSTLFIDDIEGRWWGTEFHFIRKFGEHTIIAGGEYRDNFTLNQKYFDDTGNIYLDDQRDSRNWGVFIQDEFPLPLPSLKMNASLRYDHFSTFGGTLNPRVALIYRPFPDSAFKYLVGRAFRAPDTYELYYNDGGMEQKPNPYLNEEHLVSHELIWEQLIGQSLSGTLTFYHYDIKDLISQIEDADGLTIYVNRDEVKANGVEIELNAFSRSGLNAGFSYTYQDSHYGNAEAVWTNSPRHLAKFNVSIPVITDRLFVGLEEQFTDRVLTRSRAYTNRCFLTNLTLYWKNIFPRVDFSGSIYNLFDRRYDLPGSDEHLQDRIRQDGINFRVKLTVGF